MVGLENHRLFRIVGVEMLVAMLGVYVLGGIGSRQVEISFGK
jgi:hypothetical protein